MALRQLDATEPPNTTTEIDSTKINVPIGTVTLHIKAHETADNTSTLSTTATAVVDTGSQIDVISAKTAAANAKHMRRSKFPKLVNTGNGQVETSDYLPVHITNPDGHIVFTRLWLLDSVPYDWLIGLTTTELLKPADTIVQQPWEHIPDELDGVDEGLDDMACSLLPTNRTAIDYASVRVEIEELRQVVHDMLREYDHVIAKDEMDSGCIPKVEFFIEWIDGIGEPVPVVCKEYGCKPSARIEVNRQLSKMVAAGFISDKSTSSWAAPIFCVPKKTGDVRIVFDYRKLNALTKKIKCPLPRISELLTKFKGKGFITSLDIKGGYWHIRVRKGDREKLAFVFDGKLYEWNVLPFGPTNAPAFFQRVMNEIFAPLKDFVVVYIDDISIISNTLEEHIDHLRQVFEVISKHNIHLRIDKCLWGVSETQYLGFMIDKFGIKPTEEYKKKILSVPKPETVKQLQRFLGLVQYLHQFIPNMHESVAVLAKLLQKEVEFGWTSSHQIAFDILKKHVQDAKYLKHPDETKPFHLFCDASIDGIGGMLAQYFEGVLYPVAFCSKVFSKTQRNWHVSEQEIFSVIHTVEKWRYLLLQNPFTVYTDHKNLQELFNRAKDFKSGKLYRWAVRLQDFHFLCVYIEGEKNIFADYLSRDGLGLANTGNYSPVEDQTHIHDIAGVYTTYLLMTLVGAARDQRRIRPHRDSFVVTGLNDVDNQESQHTLPLELELPDLDRAFDAPQTDPVQPIQLNDQPQLAAPEDGRRRSKRIAANPESKASKQLRSHPLLPTPSTHDREQNKQLQEQIIAINKRLLARKHDFPTWDAHILEPIAPPIFTVYNEAELTSTEWHARQRTDPQLVAIITLLAEDNVNLVHDLPKYVVRYVETGRFKLNSDGILHFKVNGQYKIVVPASMRQPMMKAEHAHLHPGRHKIVSILKGRYWWPKMDSDILDYTRTCIACQLCKQGRHRNTGKTKLFPCNRPFQMVSIDLVGPLPPTTHGYRYIVSMIDRFSRYCMLVPVRDMRALTVMQALEHWVTAFGPPECLLSDNGTQFVSALFKHYEATTEIKPKFTTTYHPECNGMIERLHRWIKERLALIGHDLDLDMLSGQDANDWSVYLNVIQYTYNTLPNTMTSMSPFDLIYGFSPMNPLEIEFDPKNAADYRKYMRDRMAILRVDAGYQQGRYDERRRRTYNKDRKKIHFEVGDLVVFNTSSRFVGNERKLRPSYVGPYEVISYDGDSGPVRLQEVANPTNVFNTNKKHIKKFHTSVVAAPAAMVIQDHFESTISSLQQLRNEAIIHPEMYSDVEQELEAIHNSLSVLEPRLMMFLRLDDCPPVRLS